MISQRSWASGPSGHRSFATLIRCARVHIISGLLRKRLTISPAMSASSVGTAFVAQMPIVITLGSAYGQFVCSSGRASVARPLTRRLSTRRMQKRSAANPKMEAAAVAGWVRRPRTRCSRQAHSSRSLWAALQPVQSSHHDQQAFPHVTALATRLPCAALCLSGFGQLNCLDHCLSL